MTVDLTFALVAPPLLLFRLLLTLSWETAVVAAALGCLVAGALVMVSDGNRSIRWLPVPLVLAHLQVLAASLWGIAAWSVLLAIELAAIAWLIWKGREALTGALLLAVFCLFYAAISGSLFFFGL